MEISQGARERPPHLILGLSPAKDRFAESGGSIVHHIDESSMPSWPAISRGALRCK